MSNHRTESQMTDNMAMGKYHEARAKVNNQKEARRQRCEEKFEDRLQQLRDKTSTVINSEAADAPDEREQEKLRQLKDLLTARDEIEAKIVVCHGEMEKSLRQTMNEMAACVKERSERKL
ncbi:hypothetical protein MBLNU457_1921t1 [Dothideomycetes sp. NU457]